jgi:hypothetical protein
MIARRALTEKKNVKNDAQSMFLFCGSYFASFNKEKYERSFREF